MTGGKIDGYTTITFGYSCLGRDMSTLSGRQLSKMDKRVLSNGWAIECLTLDWYGLVPLCTYIYIYFNPWFLPYIHMWISTHSIPTSKKRDDSSENREAPYRVPTAVMFFAPWPFEAPTVKSKKDMKNFSANREDMPPQAITGKRVNQWE